MELHFDLDTPEAVIDAVPYLLGYHPQAPSLVLIGSKDRNVTIAMGIEFDADDGFAIPSGLLDRDLTEAILLLGFGARNVVEPMMAATAFAMHLNDINTALAVIVNDGRYFDLTSDSPGKAHPLTGGTSAFATTMVAGGMQVFGSRDAIDALFAPATADAHHAVWTAITAAAPAFEAAKRDPKLLAAVTTETIQHLHDALTDSALPDPGLTARFAVALTLPAVRDAAMTAIDQLPSRTGEALWVHLVKHTSGELRTAPAVLAAYSAWRGGAGHIATAALRAIEPDYRDDLIAEQLDDLMSAAVHPKTVPAYTPGQPLRGPGTGSTI